MPAALEREIAALRGQRVRDARPRPVRGDVVRAPVGVLALDPVSGDERVDQAGMAGHDLVVPEPHAFQRFGPDVGQEDVGARDEFRDDGPPAFAGEVDRDAALGPVVEIERRVAGAVAADHPAERARRVTGRRFHLDDVSAPVGEDAAGSRAGDPHAEFDDADAGERPARRRLAHASSGLIGQPRAANVSSSVAGPRTSADGRRSCS